MLFHITAQHSWETCRGRQRAESSGYIYPLSEVSRWVEDNDDVKIMRAAGYQSTHRYYVLLEADDYNSVAQLFRLETYVEDVEILLMNGILARRIDA